MPSASPRRAAPRLARRRPWIRLLSLGLTLSCSGSEVTGPPTPPPPAAVASVDITESELTLAVGAARTVAAMVRDGTGAALNGRSVVWTTSAPAVATVAGGSISALGAGTTTIVATVEGLRDSVHVTVYVPVASVQIVGAPAAMLTGESLTLRATTLAANGDTLAGRVTTWASDSANVATVDTAGVLRAVAPGTVTITATSEGRAATAKVEIRLPVASVAIVPAADSLPVGTTRALTAVVRAQSGDTLRGRAIAWTSSDTARARVDSTGRITGVAAGTATITATVEGKSATSAITTFIPVDSIVIVPGAPSVSVGGTAQLRATLLGAAGDTLIGRPVAWTSSDTTIARITAAGLATGLKAGQATLTAASAGVTATAILRVTMPVVSVSLTPATASVVLGSTVQLTAVARSAAGDTLTGRVLTWSSDAPSIATVTDGRVTGLAFGTARISVWVEGRGALANITVVPVPVRSVVVTPDSGTLRKYDQLQLSAALRDSTGAALTGRAVTWRSLTPAVIVVSGTGLATGTAVGAGRVEAASEGVADTVAMTVTAPVPAAKITFSPTAPTVRVYEQVQVTATLTDSAGNVLSGRSMEWTSSNDAVAQVVGPGIVAGVAAGTATLRLRSDSTTATVPVSVTAAVPVSKVVVEGSPALWVGASESLEARVLDAAGNPLFGRPVTWRSSDTTKVKVSTWGGVTGVAVGSATITATAAGVSGTASLAVTIAPVASVVISPAAPTVAFGDTARLTTTVTDAVGKVVTDRQVTWSSGNPAVALVTSAGTVRGMEEGSASVIATSEAHADTVTVTVGPAPVASVTITSEFAPLYVRNTLQLTATTRDLNWRELTGRQVTWQSSDPTVASVSPSGLVTGHRFATVVITATSEGRSSAIELQVYDLPGIMQIKSYHLVPDTIPPLRVGQTVQLSGYVKDGTGKAIYNYPFVWESSDTTRLKVTQAGLLTAVGAGTADVLMLVEHMGLRRTVTSSYSIAPVASVVVTPSPNYLRVSETKPVTVKFRDASGYELDPRSGPVTWTAGSGTIVVAPTTYPYTVRGTALGSTSLTATLNGRSGSATMSVVAVAGTSVSVAPSSATVYQGRTLQLAVQAKDPSGQPVQAYATWKSSDTLVATVGNTGVVTALKVGNATITATSSEGVSGTSAIRVVADYVVALEIDPAAIYFPEPYAGRTMTISAMYRYASGFKGFADGLAWTTDNSSVATVQPWGAQAIVTTRGAGVTTLRATTASFTASAKVGVGTSVRPVKHLTLENLSLTVGQQASLTAHLMDSLGTIITDTYPRVVTWSSSDPSVVELTGTSGHRGYLRALKKGAVTVIATSEGVSDTARVTVGDSIVAADRLDLWYASSSVFDMLVGASVSFRVQATAADGKPVVGATIAWTSTNPAIATVTPTTKTDQYGMATVQITGKAVGVTPVTGALDGKQVVVHANVVQRMPVRGVQVTLYSGSKLALGSSTQATAHLRDQNGVAIPTAGRVIAWKTDNAAVATVSASGVVTATGYGQTLVWATVEGVSANTNVIVEPGVGSVTVSPNPGAVAVGGSLTMLARTYGTNGQELTGRYYSWSSSNTAVATVSNGRVTGHANGVVTITASSGGVSGTAQVTVGTGGGTGGGGGGGTGGGGGGGTGSVCSSTTSIGTPAPGQSTAWIRLLYPKGLEVQVRSSMTNHGTASAPKYEYFFNFRNSYTDMLYFSYGASTTQVQTSTTYAASVAAGATESEPSIYGPPGTLSLYVSSGRFGSFSAPSFCE